MISVGHGISIGEDELRFAYVRSPGPGGQNVNKVASAVQLRFDAARSPALTERVRRRVLMLAGSRSTSAGEVIIVARRFRSRERNRRDAVERLVALIRRAAEKQKPRRPTKPSKAARRARLETKTHRGTVKKLRRRPSDHD